MNELVSIENLSIALKQGDRTQDLVQDINLTIGYGETLGLVGESGSGKSITALSIVQLNPKPQMFHPTGRIMLDGIDILRQDEKDLRRLRGSTVGCIFQEPMTSLNPLQTVEKQLAEVLFLHKGLSVERSRSTLITWLDRVGIREPQQKLKSYPHQLSGGERQRVMIAMALLTEPKLLIADEPTTALDVTVQAQILDLLQDLQKELGMAMLFISHDLGVVKKLASRIAVMQQGKLVETGLVDDVFNSPQHPYTQSLINAQPHGEPVIVADSTTLLHADSVHVWFPVYKGVFKRTVGHVKAVNDVSFALRRGMTLGIVGESGSGKSTLAKALLGLEKAQGDIDFDNQPLIGLSHKAWQPLRRRIQVVFQDPYGSLSPRMSVSQIIMEGLEVNRIGNKESREQAVEDIMRKVGLDPSLSHRYPNEFSGGQRQRIAIARAMILNPDVVILDEPTSSLDRTVQFQILSLLKELQQQRRLTYIFISHDLKVVKSIAHHVIVMKQGSIVEQGANIFTDPQDPYTRSLVETAFAY
ncbi:ABC transporter ATP-binding protein [Reinekea sp. G2M2-21]|uniref:ABC transporter ATP-binding protein n=1 Tax=Reinekea sp. G2M2-21 TaxID=2788942 RepID=UPI0018AA42FB|nr:ABC transporter ATP-binding protein [Reinekea sp. G2M2-21]